MLLNKNDVLNFLPHRPPFLFIDSIESILLSEELKQKQGLQPKDLVGVAVVAHFKVTEDLEILKGHFPGNPILPGVVQCEMMAQASAFISLALNNLSVEGMQVETLLISVDKAKFRKPILIGMNLEIHSRIVKSRGQIASYECEVYHNSELVSEATILARLVILNLKEK